MAFNFNFFKGSTINQVQNSLHYWMNALRPAEEVDNIKQEKEKDIFANVVVEGLEDSKEDESADVATPAVLCKSKEHPNLYE
jgi:uncharacterized protein YciU (UPF0263 family)